MRARREIVIWTLIVAIGAIATSQVRRIDSAFAVAHPQAAGPSVADLVARARIGSSSLGAASQHALTLATRLGAPDAQPVALKTSDYVPPPQVDRSFSASSISAPGGAAQLLRAAMERPSAKGPRAATALAALTAATGGLPAAHGAVVSAYGELWLQLEQALAVANHAAEKVQQAKNTPISELTPDQLGELRVVVATLKVASTRASVDITSKIFELMGARSTANKYGFDRFWRDARTYTLHSPVFYKLRELGQWGLNGAYPPATFYT